MPKGQSVSYSEVELGFIKNHSTLTRKELTNLFNATFNRDVSMANISSLCKRNKWLTGRGGRFAKGKVPWIKGKKMAQTSNQIATQFKKGREPHNAKYLGHRRITKDGYIEVSINQKNKYTGYARMYVSEHRHKWQQVHGNIPPGHCLRCLDGNKQNTDPDNWILVTRAQNAILTKNGYTVIPKKLQKSIMLSIELQCKLLELRKNQKNKNTHTS